MEMDEDSSSLYMCPCYQLFQSLEEVLTHQLTCQTANGSPDVNSAAPPVAQEEPAEMYAKAPAGLPAGLVQSGPDQHQAPLDGPAAIVPSQAPGQSTGPPTLPGSTVAAKANGLLSSARSSRRRAPGQLGSSSSAPAAPLIRYQCGECGLLFESLTLWQRHNKLGLCSPSGRGGESKAAVAAAAAAGGGSGDGDGESGQKGEEERQSQSEAMAESKMEDKEIELGDGGREVKLEESECGEELSTFDHSYQVKDKTEAEGEQHTAELLECSPTQIPRAGECSQTTDTEAASKPASESSPSASSAAAPNVLPASEDSSSDRTFLCMCCGAALGSLEALASHRKARHGLEGALHRCQVCGKEFMNTTLFLYHQRQHRQQAPSQQQPTEASPARAPAVNHGAAFQKKLKETEEALSRIETEACSEMNCPPALGPPPLPVPVPTIGSPNSSASLPISPPASALVEPCPHCGQTFKRRCHLRAHMQCHSGLRPYVCDLCPKAFACKSNLARHRQTHSADRCYVCPHCGRGFTQPGSLKLHIQRHAREDGRLLQGEAGEEEGDGDGDGEKEGQVDGTLLPHACVNCGSRFRTLTQLQLHRSRHNCRLSCSECGQSFLRKRRLELHALVHQGKQPVPCPHCPEQFLNQPELDAHLRVCPRKACPGPGPGPGAEGTGGEGGRGEGQEAGRTKRRRRGLLTCELCGHHCVTQQGLELHRLSHAGLTPLRCPRSPCRRRFASEEALQSHLLSHDTAASSSQDLRAGASSTSEAASTAKPRQYRCEHCEKHFSTASSLSVHLRIHTGERPFQCPQCGKRFRQIPHLRDHERLHSGERPFVCSVCGRSFVLAGRLAEHARTHSGEKPYSCPLCSRTFRSLSNLGKHRKTHARPQQQQQQQNNARPHSPPGLQGTPAPPRRQGTVSGETTTTVLAQAGVGVGGTQALLLPAMGEGESAVHTILLLHSSELGQAPTFATLPLGGAAAGGGESYSSYSSLSPSSLSSPALSLSHSPSSSSSAPLVLMHPAVALGDGYHGQLGTVGSHAIEVIVTETGD